MAKSKNIGKGNNTRNQPVVTNPELRGRDKAKLNTYEKQELVTKIIGWIADDRLNKAKVKELIISNCPVQLSDDDATQLIRYAILRMEEIGKQEAAVVVANHMEIYEQIYDYFHSIGKIDGMNKAMRQKEKLAGIFKDKKLVINHKKNTVIERTVEYDMSRLTPDEEKLFKELINECQ